MQSSWRDNNDRILDKVGRLRRVGFLIIPVCNVFISFKRQARVSRVSKGDTNRWDAAKRSPLRIVIFNGRPATVMHLVVFWFVSTGTLISKCSLKIILEVFNFL